jgi:deoxyribose-phosphate aldolase
MIPVLAEVGKNLKIVMATENKKISPINEYIEHTLLKPDTSRDQITRLCEEAISYKFVAVCIPPYFVRYAKDLLEKSQVKVVTVVGFPLGYSSIPGKVEETKRAIEDGADEIDTVMNIVAFKSGDYGQTKDSIESLTTLCRLKNKILKVIIETCLLNDDEIIKACEICAEAGADYVKTSTGFIGEGAKIDHIKLMRKILPVKIKIKASGGIKDRDFALDLIQAGADRIGTSSGVKIVDG